MITFLLSVRSSIRYALVIIYVGCIMALSLLPPQDFPKVQLFSGIDKMVHFMMYFIFSILGCWALKTEINRLKSWFILPATIGWGIFMELLQLEMHFGRSFEWFDILANSVGVITGISIYVVSVRNS
jgi:VanZ family protein